MQNLETYFRLKKAFMPGYSATSPSFPLRAMHAMGTRLFKMLGRSEFALRQGFRLRRKRLYAPSGAAPSSSQSPLCSVSACGKNFAALPCSSSPQTTHCVGLVWGSPRWGPEELGDRKSKAARSGGFAARLGNLLQVEESLHAGILGGVAQFPIACDARNGDPDDLKCSGEVNSPCAKVFACGENACTRLPARPICDGAPRSWATEKAKPPGRAALLQN